MILAIHCPAAWCWVPLKGNPLVSDPDMQDNSPRYDSDPEGGWRPIGEAVITMLKSVQGRLTDLLVPSLEVDLDLNLEGDAMRIVRSWFSESQSPQWSPGPNQSWTNGRHRIWGMAVSGFDVAPALNIPLGDDIHFWRPDSNGWDDPDRDTLASHRKRLEWWLNAPEAETLRTANHLYAERWSSVLDCWDERLKIQEASPPTP